MSLHGTDFNKAYCLLQESREWSVWHGGEVNHFHPDYRQPREKWFKPKLDVQYRAFQCAKTTFEAAGGRIWNASRQTALDVFPRVDFDEILPAQGQVNAQLDLREAQ